MYEDDCYHDDDDYDKLSDQIELFLEIKYFNTILPFLWVEY